MADFALQRLQGGQAVRLGMRRSSKSTSGSRSRDLSSTSGPAVAASRHVELSSNENSFLSPFAHNGMISRRMDDSPLCHSVLSCPRARYWRGHGVISSRYWYSSR